MRSYRGRGGRRRWDGRGEKVGTAALRGCAIAALRRGLAGHACLEAAGRSTRSVGWSRCWIGRAQAS